MKYLKTYENSIRKIKVGDYLLIKTADNRIKNEIMIVTEIPSSYSDYFMAELPDYVDDYAIYYSEIIRRLNDKETDMYKDINKYNL